MLNTKLGKSLLFLSTSACLLAACGNTDDVDEGVEPEQETVEAPDPDEETDPVEEEEPESEEETADEAEETTEEPEENEMETPVESEEPLLTENEAVSQVREYVEANEDYSHDALRFTVNDGDEEEQFVVQVFTFGPDGGEETHTVTHGWYEVNRETGEVRDRYETDVHISELVQMEQEDREAHHRNMARNPESLSDEVFHSLMLPGIHENTEKYGGRINPDDSIRIERVDVVEGEGRTIVEPEVDEEGYFELELDEYAMSEGEYLIARITNDFYQEEQSFELLVHEPQEGMEDIQVRE